MRRLIIELGLLRLISSEVSSEDRVVSFSVQRIYVTISRCTPVLLSDTFFVPAGVLTSVYYLYVVRFSPKVLRKNS